MIIVDKQSSRSRKIFVGLLVYAISSALLIGLIYLVVLIRFGSVSVAVQYNRGHRLIPVTAQIDLGKVPVKSTRKVMFQLQNFRDRAVRITGVQPSCSCMITGTKPLSIAAHGAAKIEVELHVASEPGLFREGIVVYSDDESRPSMTLRVSGLATAP